jgi:hypothetical protein
MMDSPDNGAPRPIPALAASFFFGPDARMRITSWNSAAGVVLTLTGQMLTLEGDIRPFVFTHTPNTNRAAATTIFSCGGGWLIDAQITASSGTVVRGQCFARLEVIQGREGGVQSLGTILQGYALTNHALAFPGSPVINSTDGRGLLRSITGTDPALGVEISETVPTNARWLFRALRYTFVASAGVATRVSHVFFDDGATVFLDAETGTNITASQTFIFMYAAYGYAMSSNIGVVGGAIPADLFMAAGWRVRTSTQSIQAGDNYSAPQLLVEEWIEA